MDYERDLTINKNALDTEWLQQPVIFMRYAEKAAKAESTAKREKENLEVTYAELFMRYKTQADDNGWKSTEAILKSQVIVDPDYKEQCKVLNDALENAKILNVAVEAMQQRKYALENMVKLHLAGYFSSPKDVKDDNTTSNAKGNLQNAALNKKYKQGR